MSIYDAKIMETQINDNFKNNNKSINLIYCYFQKHYKDFKKIIK